MGIDGKRQKFIAVLRELAFWRRGMRVLELRSLEDKFKMGASLGEKLDASLRPPAFPA